MPNPSLQNVTQANLFQLLSSLGNRLSARVVDTLALDTAALRQLAGKSALIDTLLTSLASDKSGTKTSMPSVLAELELTLANRPKTLVFSDVPLQKGQQLQLQRGERGLVFVPVDLETEPGSLDKTQSKSAIPASDVLSKADRPGTGIVDRAEVLRDAAAKAPLLAKLATGNSENARPGLQNAAKVPTLPNFDGARPQQLVEQTHADIKILSAAMRQLIARDKNAEHWLPELIKSIADTSPNKNLMPNQVKVRDLPLHQALSRAATLIRQAANQLPRVDHKAAARELSRALLNEVRRSGRSSTPVLGVDTSTSAPLKTDAAPRSSLALLQNLLQALQTIKSALPTLQENSPLAKVIDQLLPAHKNGAAPTREVLDQRLNQMLDSVDSTLNKTLANQLRSALTQKTDPQLNNVSICEIPLRWNDQILPLSISVYQRREKNSPKKSRKARKNWHLRLEWALTDSGNFSADIHWDMQALNMSLWAEDSDIRSRVKKKLAQLKEQLLDCDIQVSQLVCVDRAHAKQFSGNQPRLVDTIS